MASSGPTSGRLLAEVVESGSSEFNFLTAFMVFWYSPPPLWLTPCFYYYLLRLPGLKKGRDKAQP